MTTRPAGAVQTRCVTKVAAAQFPARIGAPAKNLSAATSAIAQAAALGARIVVLPECCISGYDLDWFREGAPGGGEPVPGPSCEALGQVSTALAVAVVVNLLERANGGLYSTSVVIDRDRILGMHRKTQLTTDEEGAGLRAGDRRSVPVTIEGFPLPVAPMICFEHGFPEIALGLALAGAGVIAVSSAIRTGFEYLRNLRTRARAQDNGLYVVAANTVGGGWCGESMIIDPRGDVIARASPSDADVIVANIDPALVDQQRLREPVLERRRPDLRP